jgi:hypothetical protein
MTRRVTNKLLEMMEEGALDAEVLVRACLTFMSEADVAEMAVGEGFLEEEDAEIDEDEDEDEVGEDDEEEEPLSTFGVDDD